MDYRIKSDAAAIAGKIVATAGSATMLKTALLAVAGHADVDGYISEDDLVKIIRNVIPEESTSEKWREYRLDEDIYRRKIVYHNLACGAEIWIEYFIGNTQYVVAAGFQTMFGGGREYRIFGDTVAVYRIRHTITRI